MNLPKLVVSARRIHRFLVWLIVILGLLMMTTGAAIKYPGLLPIDPLDARKVHNLASASFSIILFLMMATGLLMYLYPTLQKFFRNNQPN